MNPRLVILLLEPVLSTEVSQVWCGGSHKMLLGISGGCRQPSGGRVQQKVSLVSRLDGAPFPSSLRRLHLCAPPQFPVHSRRHLPALKPNFFFFFSVPHCLGTRVLRSQPSGSLAKLLMDSDSEGGKGSGILGLPAVEGRSYSKHFS